MMKNHCSHPNHNKEGAALMVALWTLVILSLIVGSFAFEVNLEGMLVSHKRKRFRAEMMALSGLEYGKAILDQQQKAKEFEIEGMGEDKDGFMQAALRTQRGLSTSSTIEFDDGGKFTVTIESADGGRNVNMLVRDQWLDIFEMANIPSTDWDMMIACLKDWIDESDESQINGAESDDPFYEKAGYPVKNGPLDSVEELLLIKGWGPEILYGKPADEDSDEIFGIAKLLTVWGDGKVNLNTASEDLLLSFSEYEDWELSSVFEARMGEDMEDGTLDDGIKNLAAVGADANKFKLQSSFVKVTSVGDIFGNQYQIEAIFLLKNKNSTVVYWNEGPVKKDANAR
ncbi:MAG: type II secretion system protein GspK [Kiritimatiellaceae bacterium]|nr:type II secretion system protein GspK [Kiritimatiellaceae bacterium]